MGEMIERISKAMAEKAGLLWDVLPDGRDVACGYGMPEGCKDHWRMLTRAGVEAMREPTGEMMLSKKLPRMGSRSSNG